MEEKMKINFKLNLTTIIVAIIAIAFLFKWQEAKLNSNRWEANYYISDSTFKSYKSKTDGDIINYQNSIRLTEAELAEALKSDSVNKELASHYKKLSEVIKIKTVFVYDTIPFEVPIYINKDTTISFEDKCLEFDMALTTGRIALSNFKIENKQTLVIGARKAGLFKSAYAIDIHNTNSCLVTTGITHYSISKKKKWWENPLISGGIGIGIGYIFGTINK